MNLSGKKKRMRLRRIFPSGLPQCAYCGNRIYEPTLDHILPKSKGGTNALANLVVACKVCNLAKGGRSPEEWCEAIMNVHQMALAILRAKPR